MHTYKAFISYNHESSTRFAQQLENALKSYAKPLLQRPFKIFRDEKHFTVGVDLPKLVRDALDASEFLILLASPAAASSKWVEDELLYWCTSANRTDRLIIVLLEGSISVDNETKRIDTALTTALPKSISAHLSSVPLYLDLTWFRDNDVNMSDPRFRDAVNRISARLRDIDPNDMIGDEVRQHRRNIRLRNGAIAALTCLAIVSGTFALVANAQRKTATSRLLAAQALQPELRADVSLRKALEAYAVKPTSDSELALMRLWQQTSRAERIFVTNFPIVAAAGDKTGQFAAFGGATGEIAVWDTVTDHSRIFDRIEEQDPIAAIAFASAGDGIFTLSKNGSLCVFSMQSPTRNCKSIDLKPPFADLFQLPDGRLLVIHGLGGFAVLNRDGKMLDHFQVSGAGHGTYVTAADLHPSGLFLAIATYNSSLRIIDLQDGRAVTLSGVGVSWGVSFDHSGDYLAVSGENGALAIYKFPDWKQMIRTNLGYELHSVVFTMDNRHLIAASDSALHVLSFPELREEQPPPLLHRGRISGLTASKLPGFLFVSASEDGAAIGWRASANGEAKLVEIGETNYSALAMNKSGNVLYAGRENGAILRFDLDHPTVDPVVVDRQETMVRALDLSPDETRIAFGGQDPVVRVFDKKEGRSVAELPISNHPFDYVIDVAFSRDSEYLFIAYAGRVMQKWNIADQKIVWEKSLPLPTTVHESFCCIAINFQQRTVIIGDNGGYVYQLGELEGEQRNSPLQVHRSRISTISFSEPRNLISTVGADRRILTFDAGGQMQCELNHPDGKSTYAAVHAANGPFLFSASESSLGVWHSPDCRLIFELPVPSQSKHAEIVTSESGTNVVWTRPGHGLWSLRMPDASIIVEQLRGRVVPGED